MSGKSFTKERMVINPGLLRNVKEYFITKNYFKNVKTDAALHDMRTASKAYKKQLRLSYRKHWKNVNAEIKVLSKHDPKHFWKLLNGKKVNSGKEHPDLESFKNHFQLLNSGVEISEDEELKLKNGSNINDMLDMPFTKEEILECIGKLKNNKACGDDQILNEFLKSTSHILIDVYVKLFNLILDKGIVPQSWLNGFIIPLYKNKGDRKDADNYRGITILSCFSKLFTSIINQRLTKFADEFDIIGPEQAGFREGFSTIDHIFTFKLLLDFYLSQKKRLYCAFIDYRKAFDNIDRLKLWKKLVKYNIHGKLFNVVYNLYKHAKSCIKLNGSKSSYFNCMSGVRQGENLSPLLFSIFLSDLESFLSTHYEGLPKFKDSVYTLLKEEDTELFLNLFVLLYADDTIILSENERQLQLAINGMNEYCKASGLQINASKSKVLVFSRGKIKNKPVITFNEHVLEVVDHYVYLGIKFNYNGSFNVAIKHLHDIASRAMFVILKKGRSMNLDIDIQLKLFDSVVVPILLYGCEVWGFSNINLVEKLHLKFCKILLKVKKCTPSNMIYGELGRKPLSNLINSRIIQYWFKIVSGDISKLSSIVYRVMLISYQHQNLNCNWIQNVESVLNNLGLGFVWITQGNGVSKSWLKNKVAQILNDNYIQAWQSNVFDSNKCINYRVFKTELYYENYINVLSPKLRIAFTKFRCRNVSKLPVEVGSYTNINYCARICEKCDLNDIGDEYHYVLLCKFFDKKRKTFISSYYHNLPSMFKFNQLMNSKGKDLVRLCQFLLYIMQNL